MGWGLLVRTTRPEPCAPCWRTIATLLITAVCCPAALAADPNAAAADFQKTAKPVLNQYCFKCHNADSSEGGVAFDTDPAQLVGNEDLWLNTLKMVRAGLMPPRG